MRTRWGAGVLMRVHADGSGQHHVAQEHVAQAFAWEQGRGGSFVRSRRSGAGDHCRCWPPSSAIICPVIAGSERMASTARATSSGLVPRRERGRGGLAGELRRRLPRAGQRRAGADGVDPDARRQRQRHGLGQRPERRLRHGVGDEVRRQRPDTLVEHVDHYALGASAAARGKGLHQTKGARRLGSIWAFPGGAGDVGSTPRARTGWRC